MKSKQPPKSDSLKEDEIEPKMNALGFIRCNSYLLQGGLPHQFADKTGRTFPARQDWLHLATGMPAESKFCVLNTKTTRASSQAAMARARAYRAMNGQAGDEDLARYDKLKHQWCHSQVKQAIVQTELSPYGFLIFFQEPPTFEEMQTYTSKGLFPVPMSEIALYMLNLRLQPGGASLQLNYALDTGERAVFSLGKYTSNNPADTYVCEFVPGKTARWLQASPAA